jgi:hypothetical protein
MLLKILPFALHKSPLLVQALQSRSCLTYFMLQRQLSLFRTVVSLTTAKFKPLLLLIVPSYNSSARTPRKISSLVKNSRLLVRYLAMDVLLRAYLRECVYRTFA